MITQTPLVVADRLALARERDRLFPEELFADLFCDRGRRSVPPPVVAVVMVLQAAGSAGAQTPGGALSLLTGGVMDVRWATSPDVALAAAPGFDDQTAYVATRDGALTARDLETGAARWRVEVATSFAPAVGGLTLRAWSIPGTLASTAHFNVPSTFAGMS